MNEKSREALSALLDDDLLLLLFFAARALSAESAAKTLLVCKLIPSTTELQIGYQGPSQGLRRRRDGSA